MSIQIQVVQSGREWPLTDGDLRVTALQSLQQSLPGAVCADNVAGVVRGILRRLPAGERIGLLQVYGHGISGQQWIGGGFAPRMDQIIGVSGGMLLNAGDLGLLAGRFAPQAIVELHGCNVGGGSAGALLLDKLATAWSVTVRASAREQVGQTSGNLMVTALQPPVVTATYSPQGHMPAPPETALPNPWATR